ncbi:YihY/virulence factor BrkB family protein [Halorarius litoreus]|uniref:YihY/virulence factor BrkB family protein n=1 Tax=Halorarius litoreus TaxID=2962676 RepID=UPI0020CD5257|nr:YihY/virulence factor BrkB family protein [Halorarius litoreus]
MSFRYSRSAGNAVQIVRNIVRELREKDAPFMAGSIAYSAFVSLLPLILLLVIAASALGGERMAGRVRNATKRYLTPTGQSLVTDSIDQISSQAGLSILGVVVLLWGVLKVFRALDTSFSTIYDTTEKNDILNQFRDGLVVLVAFSVALVAVLVAGLGLRFVPNHPFPRLVSELLLIFGLSVVFIPIYYVFPDVDLSLKTVFPGAVVAAVGWVLLKAGFGIYVTYSSTQDLYGVIGGFMLLTTFLYFGALVILIGATTNAVLMGPRPIAAEMPTDR